MDSHLPTRNKNFHHVQLTVNNHLMGVFILKNQKIGNIFNDMNSGLLRTHSMTWSQTIRLTCSSPYVSMFHDMKSGVYENTFNEINSGLKVNMFNDNESGLNADMFNNMKTGPNAKTLNSSTAFFINSDSCTYTYTRL